MTMANQDEQTEDSLVGGALHVMGGMVDEDGVARAVDSITEQRQVETKMVADALVTIGDMAVNEAKVQDVGHNQSVLEMDSDAIRPELAMGTLTLADGQHVIVINEDGQEIAMPIQMDKTGTMAQLQVQDEHGDVAGVMAGDLAQGTATLSHQISSHVTKDMLLPTAQLEMLSGQKRDGVDHMENKMTMVHMMDQQVPQTGPMLLASALSDVSMLEGSGVQGLVLGQNALQLKTSSGESFQVVTLQTPGDMLGGGGRFLQILPNGNLAGTVLTLPQHDGLQQHNSVLKLQDDDGVDGVSGPLLDVMAGGSADLAGILLPAANHHKVTRMLPPGTPAWAARLNDCEKIGDSYRGWVETEVELDLLLTYHKQQTESFWGTRQSPSPGKPSTRLMWKSQYVPFDGIPFVNAGSRAIVCECQYGPRRRGSQVKKLMAEATTGAVPPANFRQTCAARIYIKKVKKFPAYQVDMSTDKKMLKLNMDKAFQLLREQGVKGHGQERYYVQLPTENAHEFHSETDDEGSCRLDPQVRQKIRDLVSAGESRLYIIRKQLRRFVEKELAISLDVLPEKHDLTYYPTVNDLQNHIHQAVKDIEAGALPVTAPMMNVEMVGGDDGSDGADVSGGELPDSLWSRTSETEGEPHAETVTVTLTQTPGEDGQHFISRVETHLSDGTTQVSTSLTRETARLLSKLHPNMFVGSQLEGVDDFDEEQVIGAVKLEKAEDEEEEEKGSISGVEGDGQALAQMGVEDGDGQMGGGESEESRPWTIIQMDQMDVDQQVALVATAEEMGVLDGASLSGHVTSVAHSKQDEEAMES